MKTVVLEPGKKGTSVIEVVRIGGSKGGLSYTFSSLAPGVTAGISSDNSSNPKLVTVHLFASYSAKPTSQKVTLTAKPSSKAVGPKPRTIQIPYLITEQYDLAIAGIDVTQGIQLPQSKESALPARDHAKPKAAVPYPKAVKLEFTSAPLSIPKLNPLSGAAPLVQRKKTMVNVYAVVVAPKSGFKGAGMLLHGRAIGGGPLPGSPLVSNSKPTLTLDDPNVVPLDAVQKKRGAFQFSLPLAWTEHAAIELEAELLPPAIYGKSECFLAACLDNNRFTLTDIAFTDTGYLEVWPLGFVLLNPGAEYLWPPLSVFKGTEKSLPLAAQELRAGGEYRAFYDATNITNQKTLLATVKAFVSDLPTNCKSIFMPFRPTSCPDLVTGVRPGGVPGISAGGEDVLPPRPGINVVNQFRPLTSVGHETGHALGFQHADTACGGNDDDQDSEPWWPDKWGLLYGITSGGNVNGSGNVGTVGVQTASSWYDFMSYCAENASDSDSWLSLVNYRRAFDVLRNVQKLRVNAFAARAAQQAPPPGAVLSVIGFVEDDSVVVTRIRPTAGEADIGPADSDYRLVLRDAVGQIVAEGPMRVEVAEGHGTTTAYVSAEIALPNVAPGMLPESLYAVEIMTDGRVAARVTRSMNAPAVSVLTPEAGQHVGGGSDVSVRWSAVDADGDTLSASLDYSVDDGATWRTIAGELTRSELSLSSRLLTTSNRARVRVRVSDGLNEALAVSERFVSLGAAPFVQITSPERRVTLGTNELVLLEAQAYDDAFAPLRARALTWFDGKRRIGFGEAPVATRMQPGVHRIRVVARDGRGRTASDSVRVTVHGDAPRLIVRVAPARLSPWARVLRLRLASTAPAAVSVTGPALRGTSARWMVGTHVKAVAIPVVPGTRPAHLVLRATAFGLSSRLILTVPRSGRRRGSSASG